MKRQHGQIKTYSWQWAVPAMAGLLIAVTAAGLIGLGINSRVRSITAEAVNIDIELEDRGDDFRVSVLDVRHYHRNIMFAGPTRLGLTDFDAAYQQMITQIDRLAELEIDDPRMPQLSVLREKAEAYYEAFRPAIELYDTDRAAFDRASDQGLAHLAELSEAGRIIDHLGEQRSAAALRSVEAASQSAQLVLISVLGGLTLVGVGLTYLVIRNMRQQRLVSLELARSLQFKNDFIADASHELRTPLTVLRANAELAHDLKDADEQTELLEEILAESDRMTRLIDDLLFLASSDAGSLPIRRDLVEVERTVAGLADRATTLAREFGTHLQTDLTATGLAELDGARIEQAGLILVDNAGKYGGPGSPIWLRSRTLGSELMIEVEDFGPGIPEEDLPSIFERFYRVDKARSRRQGGTGLGLAIARTIVEAHDGRIEAESKVGRGTMMRIFLPILSKSYPARRTSSLVHKTSISVD